MTFDEAFDRLIGFEGGYTNNSADPGGATCWGITARVAIQNGYTGDMRSLPRDTAKAIYRAKYWDVIHADELPEAVRYPVFDAAVNSGVSQALKWLQGAVGVGEDGVIGPMTIAAAQRADGMRLAVRMLAERLDFMTQLPTWGSFSRGWTRRIVENLKALA